MPSAVPQKIADRLGLRSVNPDKSPMRLSENVHLPFDKPFDKLTVLSKVEGPFDKLTVLSGVEGLRYPHAYGSGLFTQALITNLIAGRKGARFR